MNENIAQEILQELFSSLEALETQSTAISSFLKDKGIATEEELAPHFEPARKASSVRWRAARVRIDYLLSSAMKTAEENAHEESPKTADNKQEPAIETDTQGKQKTAVNGKRTADNIGGSAEVDRNQQTEEDRASSGENSA